MTVPIYANEEHKQAVETYLNFCDEFVKEVSNSTRYDNYNEVLNVILEYHNNYGNGKRENNYWDWLMIIPINVSVMVQGYFAGIETKKNASKIRAYRVVLAEMLEQLINKIEKIEPTDE
jgi:hypothetical protein